MSDLLLDTCAVLWLAEGIELVADARKAVADGNLNVSPISAWEIANLVRKNRIALAMPIIKMVPADIGPDASSNARADAGDF